MDAIEKNICRNPNHPKKGSTIKVEPIRKQKDIDLIKKMLEDHPRNYALFVVGINTNLRASDLTRITIGHVLGVEPGQMFYRIREKKTGKLRDITMNKSVYLAVKNLLNTLDTIDESAFLFQSRKGKGKGKLTEVYINELVKKWCSDINLRGRYGAHSLRKTWGYMMRTKHNIDIPTLMTVFNHSSQRETLNYLCIQEQEVHDCYMKEI